MQTWGFVFLFKFSEGCQFCAPKPARTQSPKTLNAIARIASLSLAVTASQARNGVQQRMTTAYRQHAAQLICLRKSSRELPYAERDDVARLHHLRFSDHQRRREADDVPVRGFGEQAIVAQQETELPSGLG